MTFQLAYAKYPLPRKNDEERDLPVTRFSCYCCFTNKETELLKPHILVIKKLEFDLD